MFGVDFLCIYFKITVLVAAIFIKCDYLWYILYFEPGAGRLFNNLNIYLKRDMSPANL